MCVCVYKYTHLYTYICIPSIKLTSCLLDFTEETFFGGGQYINLTIYKFIVLLRVRSAVMRVPEELSRSEWLVRQGKLSPVTVNLLSWPLEKYSA